MNVGKLVAIFVGIYFILGLLAFFVISALMKPSNLQEWGEFAKVLGIALTLFASVMATVVTLVVAQQQMKVSRSVQLEVIGYQRQTEAMKLALPEERQAYFELYKSAMGVFNAFRPLDYGQWNEEAVQQARQEVEKVKASILLLQRPEHRKLWQEIMQRIEYIAGEVKKRQQDPTSQTEFWLSKSGDFAQKLKDFENAALECLQYADEEVVKRTA